MGISIHAPLTGSDRLVLHGWNRLRHFNPRSPYGERLVYLMITHDPKLFQSTLPLRGATGRPVIKPTRLGFQSTLPLRGATVNMIANALARCISIHAPLTGSDSRESGTKAESQISIHAPLTGSDSFLRYCAKLQTSFQSTLPLRGATAQKVDTLLAMVISIHAPLTGSDMLATSIQGTETISIHAPLTGSDIPKFSTPSSTTISIHAPLTGSDRLSQLTSLIQSDFNPRSPYGERLHTSHHPCWDAKFQSTLPLRGATKEYELTVEALNISIHAPLTGSDYRLQSN